MSAGCLHHPDGRAYHGPNIFCCSVGWPEECWGRQRRSEKSLTGEPVQIGARRYRLIGVRGCIPSMRDG
jgi:hypothetical protein